MLIAAPSLSTPRRYCCRCLPLCFRLCHTLRRHFHAAIFIEMLLDTPLIIIFAIEGGYAMSLLVAFDEMATVYAITPLILLLPLMISLPPPCCRRYVSYFMPPLRQFFFRAIATLRASAVLPLSFR